MTLRLAFRALSRHRTFAAVAILTLALGIGATTSVFSVVSAVLLRPLGYADEDRLVVLWQSLESGDVREAPTSIANFQDWRERSRSFSGLAAFNRAPLNLIGGERPERLMGIRATHELFTVLGTPASVGRTFGREDGEALLAVLGQGLWQRRFGGDSGAIGRTVNLDGRTYQIVGVMPPDFSFGEGVEIWVTSPFAPEATLERGNLFLETIGRLAPGVRLARAREEMAAIAKSLAEQFPDVDAGWSVRVVPLAEQAEGDIEKPLLVLFGAVGFVLLVSCANVASLLLARATERTKEMAIRTSLGADRGALLRQSVGEGLALSLVGAVLALGVTYGGVRLLIDLNPTALPRLGEAGIDWRVAGFTAGLCLLTGLFFGLVPALHAATGDLHETLKEGGGVVGAARGRRRLRAALAVVEIALALVLLIGAGLLIRSFQQLRQVDPGFDPSRALTAQVVLPAEKYRSIPERVVFFEALVERLRSVPAVESVGAVSTLPMTGGLVKEIIAIPGRHLKQTEEAINLDIVTPDYFRAMGVRLLKGRTFTAQDRAGSAPVSIVDESMARRYWPGESAIGQRVALPALFPEPTEVVGVVGSVRRFGLDRDPQPQLYLPLGGAADRRMDLAIRTRTAPEALASAVRSAVLSIDPDQPVSNLRPLSALVAESIAQQRFNARLMTTFAGLGLLLALAGIYGVLSYSVAQRTREIGVRMALGGTREQVLRLFLGAGARLVGLGLGLGLALAFALVRLLDTLLPGVESGDLSVVAGVVVAMGAIGLLASYFPARRATSVDPIIALRND